ncbi:uncharacterized protein BDZ99DRAFT_450125 [Mytilinidion resinicola]|uniref:Uncharacterized protein n=1 Tax=Mytilinidion resinicola TaxID=574789 RepID=A0A6A6YBP5_9PEZI|nr:uncharacterized protein BDZ99DRAFT_450125 [Mytilinidion resinicola]KAF2805525.1 hypothetical protein BDZ99DRAFT_450125 [Mytilinidion resinicola]
MATLLAPYNTAMQLGSGFNSFTQQMCIDHAVTRDPDAIQQHAETAIEKQVAQEVIYKTSIVDKVTDVTSAMNINAAFSIKYDTFNATGKGDFINTSKVKESDISFMITVKVVNQVIYDYSLTKFQPISGLKTNNFADVYGDCFISGFQEGGEFTAVISVKAKDRQAADTIKAQAAIEFTKDKLEVGVNGQFNRDTTEFLKENETTVSVTWTGGGQNIKGPAEDWTFETMKAAALKFPQLVSQTPMRTHAILTKYTALRSFQATNLQASIPYFEKAGVYTNILQEAYLDYKTIAKNLQILAYDFSAGAQTLVEAPAAKKAIEEKQSKETDSINSDDMVPVSRQDTVQGATAPLRITEPYPATLQGLESARQVVRFMLNRIVGEVDAVTRNPDLATDEKRRLPYMSPFLFKEYLPVGVPVPSAESAPAIAAAPANDVSGLTGRMGSTMRF